MGAIALFPSLLPLLMVIAMRRAERSIHRQLVDVNALTEGSAIQLSLTRSFHRRRLQGLTAGGAIRQTASGRHYLDQDGWAEYQANRRRRVLLAASIVVAVLGIGFMVLFVFFANR